MDYDIIVIGGGPSGLMACLAASRPNTGASVLLIDKGDKLGRKLGISGGGRCNVTNAQDIDVLIKHIPGNGRFLYSALSEFGNRDIIALFEQLGILLKEEDRGRMFPVSDKAKTVVDALVGQVRRQGVTVRVNTPVDRVIYADGRVAGVQLRSGETITCRCVIIATGGKSVPHTGSTGDGYPWAEDGGHTITELYPTEVPLVSAEPFIRSKELQGLSLRGIELSVLDPKGKKIISHEGDMIFTHFGISGPTVLRCSQFVVKAKKKYKTASVTMAIDFFPALRENDVYDLTLNLCAQDAKKAIKNVLKGLISERLLPLMLVMAGLKEDLTYANIPRQPWRELAKLLKGFPLVVSGTLSIEEAFVTGGGVNLKEIEPRTMSSKLTAGLYFCGEVLDIHGYTGGYNITAAFSTGYAAGKSASESLL